MSKRWKPKFLRKYYYIYSMVEVDIMWWNDNDDNKFHYSIGNCFRTKKEATAKMKEIKKVLKGKV